MLVTAIFIAAYLTGFKIIKFYMVRMSWLFSALRKSIKNPPEARPPQANYSFAAQFF
jgi:hypothetical protein